MFGLTWKLKGLLGLLLPALLICSIAKAHQPTLEQPDCQSRNLVECAVETLDPTYASSATYGSLVQPREVDVYKFTPQLSETIPVEALVPVRESNRNFRPAVLIFGEDLSGIQRNELNKTQLPFEIPAKYQFHLIPAPEGERTVFFEPYSVEKLWDGREEQIPVQAGKTYYLVVFSPDFQAGDYSLGIGIKENFENASFISLIGNILKIKFGLASGKTVDLFSFIGMFLLVLGIALGLGASLLGLIYSDKTFLWANLTGLILSIVGSFFAYQLSGLSGVAVFQIICAVVIGICLFVLFRKRRDLRLPRTFRIITAQLFALLGWLIGLGLFVWHILVLR